MPIYEYQCQKCGTFEATQRITEKALAKCPTCKGKVKKLISNTSFQLKGTGWYVTDYKGNGKSPASSVPGKTADSAKSAPSESKPESKNEAKSETKSEAKSESKSESKPAPAST